MKTDIEVAFFESTILDIDFSHWGAYIQLCVLSRWGSFQGNLFPSEEIKVVRFFGPHGLCIKLKEGLLHNEVSKAILSPGIEVNSISLSAENKSKTAHIDAMEFDTFNISYDFYELYNLPQKYVSILSSLNPSHGTLSFIRPDVEFISERLSHNFIRNKPDGISKE